MWDLDVPSAVSQQRLSPARRARRRGGFCWAAEVQAEPGKDGDVLGRIAQVAGDGRMSADWRLIQIREIASEAIRLADRDASKS